MSRRQLSAIAAAMFIVAILVSSWDRPGAPTEVIVPPGATLSQVADSLSARGIIRGRALFELYARARRADRKIKAGRYELATSSSWASTLRRITRGEVATEPLTIPEGFTLAQMAPRIAEATEVSLDSVEALLADPELGSDLGVPGPGVEGYLFPDTYLFASGVAVSAVLEAMVERYRAVWTPERRIRLEELGMTEQEIVTLASIVQAEARHLEEMPRISGVYHNRLELGWLLEADPTWIAVSVGLILPTRPCCTRWAAIGPDCSTRRSIPWRITRTTRIDRAAFPPDRSARLARPPSTPPSIPPTISSSSSPALTGIMCSPGLSRSTTRPVPTSAA